MEGLEIPQSPVSSTGSSLSIASRPASASAIIPGSGGAHLLDHPHHHHHHQLTMAGVVPGVGLMAGGSGVVGVGGVVPGMPGIGVGMNMGMGPPHVNLHIRSVGSPSSGVGVGSDNYKCAYCGFYTEDINKMKKHKRTHQEKQPYRCEFCLKQFTKPHQLKEHVLVHTGEKPYSCEFCDQKFRQQNALKVRGSCNG